MPRKDKCPTCDGYKDTRSLMCIYCRMKYNHPRLGTSKGWYEYNGYIVGCHNGKYEYQHRVVMEEKLGRTLSKREHVHHIDGDKSNNHPDNLEILSDSMHHSIHMTQGRAKEISALGHKARWGYEYVTS